ncbi:hypothetical protein CPB84DRAFT_1826154 [Gymnopilus junonius]|uniref:Uncharacterized protein n=1 Tax=Gymnopilus junonius TaxID=109634 RepID=A0A9P5TKF9_GYMJU|nr:hypothetical protein CPB84DRAFT_1826154 [Gymnopilus junonius]
MLLDPAALRNSGLFSLEADVGSGGFSGLFREKGSSTRRYTFRYKFEAFPERNWDREGIVFALSKSNDAPEPPVGYIFISTQFSKVKVDVRTNSVKHKLYSGTFSGSEDLNVNDLHTDIQSSVKMHDRNLTWTFNGTGHTLQTEVPVACVFGSEQCFKIEDDELAKLNSEEKEDNIIIEAALLTLLNSLTPSGIIRLPESLRAHHKVKGWIGHIKMNETQADDFHLPVLAVTKGTEKMTGGNPIYDVIETCDYYKVCREGTSAESFANIQVVYDDLRCLYTDCQPPLEFSIPRGMSHNDLANLLNQQSNVLLNQKSEYSAQWTNARDFPNSESAICLHLFLTITGTDTEEYIGALVYDKSHNPQRTIEVFFCYDENDRKLDDLKLKFFEPFLGFIMVLSTFIHLKKSPQTENGLEKESVSEREGALDAIELTVENTLRIVRPLVVRKASTD